MQTLSKLACSLAALAYGCAIEVDAPDLPSAPTYYADIAPRIARSCLPCHAEGDDTRPRLGSLRDARTHAAAMLFAVESGMMPPGGIDRSGDCGTFLGPAPFTPADIEVLRRWLDSETPAGTRPPWPDEAFEPAAPTARFDRRLDLALPLSRVATDESRCFLVDTALNVSTYLAGVAVSNAGAVHHAMVFSLTPGAADEVRALDDADTTAGWACPGIPQGSSALLFAWVPGQALSGFPAGAGVHLQDEPLVVQIHQHGPSPEPNAVVSLLLVDQVEHELMLMPVAATGFVLPAGAAHAGIERSVPLARDGDVLVFGVMPHMHQAGRSTSLRVDDGACLVDVPRYDFTWQEQAFYQTPIVVHAGAQLSLACSWDTRDRASAVPWGESSSDEMCTVFLFVTDRPGTRPR